MEDFNSQVPNQNKYLTLRDEHDRMEAQWFYYPYYHSYHISLLGPL